MEAYYVVLARAKEAVRFEEQEQEEDIGCASSDSVGGSASSSSDEVELADDASSSGSTGDDHFEMASLMTQLPIKRGLSKFFDGKSQSFASLAAVGGLEDLPKPPAKRLKTSRSCGVGLKDALSGRFPAVYKKQPYKARLSPSAPRRLARARARALLTASPATTPAVAGQPLLFA